MSRRVVLTAALVTIGTAACVESEPDLASVAPSTGIRFLADGEAEGFARAETMRSFTFPVDHGGHPDYRTEWWYFTGNVFGANERHYGFQVTFFRLALTPTAPESISSWATNQFWMAHFALTDTANGDFITEERLTRGALGLAGATHTPFRVWVEDWYVEGEARDGSFAVHLLAEGDAASIDLTLTGLKAPVAQGERGLDRKGPEPGNASYYYSLPRLEVRGSLRVGDADTDDVMGLAWMDREWGTSALSEGVVGWDWFALQLSDGSDLMFYRLRRNDGTAGPYSGGALIGADGRVQRLAASDVELEVLDRWTSPVSRAQYPVAWKLVLPRERLELEVTPYLPNQELNLSVRYWEGAVRVSGRMDGQPLSGNGYLELAGY